MSEQTDRAPLSIRGHHLLCLFGFRGLGYSPEFIRNTQRVADAFFGEAAVKVRVVAGCDDICRACPHLKGVDCAGPTGVGERDAAVLTRLGMKPGTVRTSAALRRLVVRKIPPADLPDICQECEWLAGGYCAEGLARRGELEAGKRNGPVCQ